MASDDTPLTLGEKLGVAKMYGTVFLQTIRTNTRNMLLPQSDPAEVKKEDMMYITQQIKSLSPRQQKAITPSNVPTHKAIASYCSKNHLQHTVDPLPHGASLHWVGPRQNTANEKSTNDEKILLCFHGGGYHRGIAPTHLTFHLRLAHAGSASLAILEYSLTPTSRYPTQLRQAVASLKHLLTLTPASQITIAGNSSGGHLAVGLLSHLGRPSEVLERVQLLEGSKLGGILLISPFLSFNFDKQSYTTCNDTDVTNLSIVQERYRIFKPSGMSDEEALKDPRLSPLDAPGDWWNDSPVEKILLVYGTSEVFLDDCKEFGERLKRECSAGTEVEVVGCEGEVHAACLVDQALGCRDGGMAKAVLGWMGGDDIQKKG